MILFFLSLLLFFPRMYFPEFSEEAFLLFSIAVSLGSFFYSREETKVPCISFALIFLGILYSSPFELSGRPEFMNLAIIPLVIVSLSFRKIKFQYILILYGFILLIGWLDVLQFSHPWVGSASPDSLMILKSIFNQKNEFQLWNSLGILYLIFLYPRVSSKSYKVLILIICLNAVVFLLISKAKAAIIVLTLVLVYTYVKNLKHRVLLSVFILLSIIFLTQGFIPLPKSLQIRFALFEATFKLILDHGIWGLGLDGYAYHIREYFIGLGSEWSVPTDRIFRSPHNIVLHYWVSFGLIGFILILVNISYAIKGFYVNNSKYLLTAYLVLLGNSMVNEPTSMQFLSHTLFWVFTIRGVALNLNWSKYSLDINRMSLKIIMTLCLGIFSYQYFQFKLAEVDFFQFRHENFYEEGRIKEFDLKNHQIYSELNKQTLFWDFIIQTRHGDLEEIKRAHLLLLEKTHNYFPWRHHLALGFAKNNLWGACEDNEAISLSMWSHDNVVSLNLMAKCKYHQNCQEFLKWKNLNEKYWVKRHDQQSFFWTIESCEIPDEPLKVF